MHFGLIVVTFGCLHRFRGH